MHLEIRHSVSQDPFVDGLNHLLKIVNVHMKLSCAIDIAESIPMSATDGTMITHTERRFRDCSLYDVFSWWTIHGVT